jgi:hypothetical protein
MWELHSVSAVNQNLVGVAPPLETKTKLINKTIRITGCHIARIVKAEFLLSAVHSATPGSGEAR